MTEFVVSLSTTIAREWPEIDAQRLAELVDGVACQYDIKPAERGLAVRNDLMDFMNVYLNSKMLDGLSPKTIKGYEQRLTMFNAFICKDLKTVEAMDIRRFLAAYGNKSGCSKATMGSVVSILRSYFGWLQDQDYIVKNPMRQIKATKQDKRMRKSLTEEELERLRLACADPMDRAIIEMYYSTGCRLSELVGVNLGQIDWGELSFRVIGKGSKERQVYFNAKARLHLDAYLLWRGSRRDSDPLFMTVRNPHGRLSGRQIQKRIAEIARRAGLNKPVYPHLLRHTYATLAVRHGSSITAVQHLLGHSSPATTQIYAEADQETVRHEYRRSVAQ